MDAGNAAFPGDSSAIGPIRETQPIPFSDTSFAVGFVRANRMHLPDDVGVARCEIHGLLLTTERVEVARVS